MTSPRRLEQDLPAVLADLYLAGTPDYRDDLVRQTARVRQRPAWTFPERWLPMAVVTRRSIFAPNVPWRTLGVLALLAILVVAALVAYVGSQTRLPAPFGRAANGLVAFAKDGDIYTADPVTGAATAVVTGSETDLRPAWSLDGTRFVFERKVHRDVGAGLLFVAKADGSGLTLVTPEPLDLINDYAFSPDGKQLLITEGREGYTSILIASTDGTDIRTLPLGTLIASKPAYRPPNGAEIVFIGQERGQSTSSLYIVKPDGTDIRRIVPPSDLIMVDPRWSPDGSRIAYTAYSVNYDTTGSLLRIYLVTPDGQTNRILRDLPSNDLEKAGGWSNDGSRVIVSGCYSAQLTSSGDCRGTFAVIPVDGSGPVVEIDLGPAFAGADATTHFWAPDDGAILTTLLDRLRKADDWAAPLGSGHRPIEAGTLDGIWGLLMATPR